MAQKPVKKTAARKSAPAKRTTAKKSTPIEKDVIIIADHDMHHAETGCNCHHPCNCGCMDGKPCTCKCGGGFWRFIKRLFWFLVIFALGFVACMLLCNNGPRHHRGAPMPVEFVNGCLDMEKIACPELQTKLMSADTNNDGCVSREEYRTAKQQFRHDHGARHAK